MTKVSIQIEGYNNQPIHVDAYEGQVHIDTRVDAEYPSITPDEARTLAAVLMAQADAAERR